MLLSYEIEWGVFFCAIPRPLIPLVSQRDVNHSHQSFLEEGPVTLSIILL